MSDHRRALLENAFFTEAKLDGDALAEMAAALEERRFTKGQRIFNEGDVAPDMFFVVCGRVAIGKAVGNARLQLAEVGPGGYFGEIALVDGGARSADADALEDVELLALRDEVFDELLERVPRLALFFLKATSKRLRETNRQASDEARQKASGDPLRDRLPFPIASVYASMAVLVDGRPRLERFFDLLEVTIRHIGSLALAQYLAAGARHGRVDHSIAKGLGGLTLGRWLALSRFATAPGVERAGEPFVPELHACLASGDAGVAVADRLRDIIEFRNRQRHGAGGALTDAQAAEALRTHEQGLRDVLGRLAFLGEYPLVWLERMDFSRGRFLYRYLSCMGSHVDFPTATVTLRAPLDTGQLYLMNPQGTALLPLDPLMRLDTCVACAHREVFFLAHVAEGSVGYCEFRRGHLLATAEPLEAIEEMRATVRARRAAPTHELPLDEVLGLLRLPDVRNRTAALRELGARADRRATRAVIDAVEAAMARGDGTLVADGLGVLGKLRDGRALAVLTRAAALPAFALPAVRALGRLGRKEAASTLLAALGQPELRQAAERALVALGRPGLAHGVVVSRDEARQQWVVADGRGESRAFSASVVRGTGELRVGQPVTFFPFEEAGRTSAAHVAAVVAPALAATGSGVEAEGVVRWYDPAKGLGFVRDAATGGDVLVSFADIDPAGAANATGPLRARQRVRYVRFPTARGFRASSVAPLGDTAEGTNATATHG